MEKKKDTYNNPNGLIYFLPCKPGSVYINITANCLNDCLFCIRRNGSDFYGSDLSIKKDSISSEQILSEIKAFIKLNPIQEVVVCGMGEPLLEYNMVTSICQFIKNNEPNIQVRVDTSGLFWADRKDLGIIEYIDILNISLNAQNSDLYNELCQPRIPNAFNVLIDFLDNLKREEIYRKKTKSPFPIIRLSVVNTSEEEFIPISGKTNYRKGEFPIPDFKACESITNSYNWEFQIKRLFRDSQDEYWKTNTNFKSKCANGIQPEYCADCNYKH